MTTDRPSGSRSPTDGLPYEPKSSSEILSATHLFAVGIVSRRETPWAGGEDGLERRRLNMEARLLETYKGELDVSPGQTFTLEVVQEREDEFLQTDYHGLWSHLNPAVGSRCLVVAQGSLHAPGRLMQEGPCKRLADAGYEADVRLALEAEQAVRDAVAAQSEEYPRSLVATTLLDFTRRRAKAAKDMFARYLWARLEPAFGEPRIRPLDAVLELIAAEGITAEMRAALVESLYRALLRDPEPDLHQKVVRAFLLLLADRHASAVHHRLVEVELSNLVFEDDKPRLAVETVLPDARERASVKAAVTGMDADGAEELAKWLEGSLK